MRIRGWWIRALLGLYPAEFRRAHRQELEELYRELELGTPAMVWDLLVNAVRMRVELARDGRLLRPRPAPRSRPSLVDGLRSDLRSSVRALRARPGLAALVVATLALGIGANVAIFTVLHWVVLRPLPFPRAEEVVRVWWRPDSFNQRIVARFRERGRSFEGLSAFSGWSFVLTGEGEPEEISGAVVSSNHFNVLGVSPILGRGFSPEEEEPGRTDVCILSEGLWKRRFGGEPSLLGRSIQLAGAGRASCTVVGIVSDAHAVIDAYGVRQAFLPLERAADLEKDESWFLSVLGRLRPGVSLEEANAEVRALARLVREQWYPRTSEEEVSRARVETLRDAIVGSDRKAELFLVAAVAAVVLLVACFNLSALLLARYGEREREIALRSALGGNRLRVLRQLLVESSLLGLGGGVAGTLLALGSMSWLASRLPAELPRAAGLSSQSIGGGVLAFALAISILASLAVGWLPAVRASGKSVASSLRAGRAAGELRRHRLDRWLVLAEVASCLVLLTAAGFVVEGFRRLTRIDPGFDAEPVLVAAVQAPDSSYSDEAKRRLFRELLARISSAPGIESAGSIHILPFDPGNWDFPFYPQGWVLGPSETPPRANFRVISPGYVSAMGIPLLEGRDLTPFDRNGGAPVGLVNESLAKAIWPAESAVGKELRIFQPRGPAFTIVGVVGDVRQHGLALAPRPEMYRPLDQWSLGRNVLVIRTASDPEDFAGTVRDIIRSVDDELPVVTLSPMSEIVRGSVATSRFVAALLAGFALLALTLAAVGVYGVAASIASSRRREIGIRMALGASSGAVLGRVLLHGMAPVAGGVALGLVGAGAVAELLSRLLPAVAATDPAILVAVSLFLAAVALAACYLPARRASRIDPMQVLRLD